MSMESNGEGAHMLQLPMLSNKIFSVMSDTLDGEAKVGCELRPRSSQKVTPINLWWFIKTRPISQQHFVTIDLPLAVKICLGTPSGPEAAAVSVSSFIADVLKVSKNTTLPPPHYNAMHCGTNAPSRAAAYCLVLGAHG
jgi:hypothetical protein